MSIKLLPSPLLPLSSTQRKVDMLYSLLFYPSLPPNGKLPYNVVLFEQLRVTGSQVVKNDESMQSQGGSREE